jgi:hypothetical protein
MRSFSAIARDIRDLADILGTYADELEVACNALSSLVGGTTAATKLVITGVQPAQAPPKEGFQQEGRKYTNPGPHKTRKLSQQEKEQIKVLWAQADRKEPMPHFSKERKQKVMELAETYKTSYLQVSALLFNDVSHTQNMLKKAQKQGSSA